MYLYIDTSHQTTIGLLSENYEWVELIQSERKASFVQSEIAKLLKNREQEFSDVKKVYYSAGPGSYTGMRIVQGFIGTLEAINVECHGVYLFDLLTKLGIEKSCWVSSAFKGEFFFAKDNNTFLMTEPEAKDYINKNSDELYSFDGNDFLGATTKSMQALLKKNPQVFKLVSGKQEPYYYRPLEKEFSVKKS